MTTTVALGEKYDIVEGPFPGMYFGALGLPKELNVVYFTLRERSTGRTVHLSATVRTISVVDGSELSWDLKIRFTNGPWRGTTVDVRHNSDTDNWVFAAQPVPITPDMFWTGGKLVGRRS